MNFGEALQALKEGKHVKRSIWGGHWSLIKNAGIAGDTPMLDGYTRTCNMGEIIVASLRDNGGSVPAQPYQQDLLAEDWQIVE